jgi:uncharacterized protein YnzC (UPF0291/DUF896 family)
MPSELLKRINELANLSKERALTPEEKEEQKTLREQYLKNFRAMMRQTLDNTVVIHYPDNTKEYVRDRRKKKD